MSTRGRQRGFGIRCAGAAAIVLALFAGQGQAADDKNDDAVAYRRHVMRTLGEQAAALALVLQNKGPAENAAHHARIIAIAAETAVRAFEPKAPGGESKPEVWRNWPDFAKRFKTLSEGANELAVIAERDGLPAMQARVMNVLSCKSCHDIYRERQGR